MIEQKPFRKYSDEDKKETFTMRITEDDKSWFPEAKKIIRQPKNSTAMKQLAKIGYAFVLHDEKIRQTVVTIVENIRKNNRTGVTDSEYKFE